MRFFNSGYLFSPLRGTKQSHFLSRCFDNLNMTSLILTFSALESFAPRLERSSFVYIRSPFRELEGKPKAGVEGGNWRPNHLKSKI